MIDEVKRRLAENALQPFAVVSSSGMRYRIASRDHVSFSPHGGRLVIFFDDDSSLIIASLHITAIEEEPSVKQSI